MKIVQAIAFAPALALCSLHGAAASTDGKIVSGTKDAAAVTRMPIEAASGKTTRRWDAQVDYDHTLDRPDLVAGATLNRETARPAFATLRRSFGDGGFRPYVGVGVGQASAKFAAVAPGEADGYAVKGVVGGALDFTETVGAYMQYEHAVAGQNPALAEEEAKSHGFSVGLKISLN